ncbi:Mitogen-activated protein kinase kinase kinase [Trema orientale]|uniref:Mitogen-activated protein kinase kinase kinase n=1 Tax=Trema orientale TaxID=63057 RepID=A0A2P5DY85_TREOI|nr:Mitogen-activated protein kinase kinase kinase [Trema orientale]
MSYGLINLLQTVLVLFLIPTLLQHCVLVQSACNQVERDSLLAFYNNTSTTISKPHLNWPASEDCCTWEGIRCAVVHGQDRVTHLWLPLGGLRGNNITFSSLTNLTHLSHLNLSRNFFHGPLPLDFFSSLRSLRVLDLSYNRLQGELPLGRNDGVLLQTVDLSSNFFEGIVPTTLFRPAVDAGSLTAFNVSNNSFSGQLPISAFCLKNGVASSTVKFLDFSFNEFSDEIPSGLGGCSELQVFRAGFNNLTGPIPGDIYDVKTLEQISLPVNRLSGRIQGGIGGLSKLRVLELYSNQLNESIPEDIGKLASLERLLLHINNISGFIPSSLMNCTNLSTLNLRVNSLAGDLSAFNFSPLQRLATLDLGNNNFTGEIPRSLYSCKSLRAVRLAGNWLRGQLLPDILELKSLSFFSISNNSLTNITGALSILQGSKSLTALILSKNFMLEDIPEDDDIVEDPGGFQNLQILALGGCLLSGRLPTWLVKLKKLQVLDLSVNLITGSIPGWLGSLPSLFYLDLATNLISGELPRELCELPILKSGQSDLVNRTYLELPVFVMPNNATNQQYNQLSNLPPAIYLSNNKITGSIPIEIGQLKFLHVLGLNNNSFSGSIPDQISGLTNLERLDLSLNNLTGEIPASLNGLHFLSYFSVASNDLRGPVPSGGQFDTFPSSSFDGNPGLCGPPTVQRSLYLGTGFLVTILAAWIVSRDTHQRYILDRVSSTTNHSAVAPVQAENEDTSFVKLFPNNAYYVSMDLAISEILKATDNFSESNIIGCGNFSLVYKATLPNGSKLAIKKLLGDLGMMGIDFETEVEALSKAQHENLISLEGYFVHDGVQFLVHPYMENGSLHFWLHEKVNGAMQLDWPTRLKIAKGACSGLAYIRQLSTKQQTVFNLNIKSSNILLNADFKPHLSGFRLSRSNLAKESGELTTELVSGSFGYKHSDDRRKSLAILRGEVYSFGVVMLELLTGKRPVEVLKPKMPRELVGWVQQMRNEEKHDQVFDRFLRGKGFENEMMQVLDLASTCLNRNAFMRPTMEEVAERLKNIGTMSLHHYEDE